LKKRFLILTEGNTQPTPAKTAMGIIRYRRDEVVALLDSTQSGRDASELLGIGEGIPIVGSIEQALPLKPNTLLIGIAPAGGRLPESWRVIILQAIRKRLDIISGLHMFLGEDPNFVSEAHQQGVTITDLRHPPQDLSVSQCLAKKQTCFRIHTVGTDGNCGKKVTAIELDRSLKKMGKNSQYIATGQTGILISGKGIAIDRVVSDFISGAAERLVLENANHDYLILEGQGAITHPLYSGVTLGMLHGFMPQALVLCHQPDRKIMRGSKDTPVMSPEDIIPLYESIAKPVFPTKVIGIALNLRPLSVDEAKQEVEETENRVSLPTTDVLKFGTDKLIQTILNFESQWRKDHMI
jgi:uncharacterized NAD-dependent epimerase/dehydratase family protein